MTTLAICSGNECYFKFDCQRFTDSKKESTIDTTHAAFWSRDRRADGMCDGFVQADEPFDQAEQEQ